MLTPPKVSQKASKTLCFFMMTMLFGSDLHADVPDDEESIFYEITVEKGFRSFFKKYKRYPLNWIELRRQSSCMGYVPDENKHFPKPNEGLVWRPSECEMSYQLVYSSNKAFKVVALKDGHVVSIFENYKATYLKTPYHSHEPAMCPENSAC